MEQEQENSQVDEKESTDESDKEIHKKALERLAERIEEEEESRAKMLDDLRFATLDQWDDKIRKERENDPNGARPCLTIDKINQYIAQVTNDMRKNKPGIKVRPVDDAADVDTAKVFQGLTRHIEDKSAATVAYETASDWSVKVGLGYFRIVTDYVSPDSFDQEIQIKRIPNMFSVYLGPHTQPDGSDAEWGFILEEMPIENFKSQWPKAKLDDNEFSNDKPVWKTEENITIAEYFYTDFEHKKLLFLKSGESVFSDKYDGPEENISDTRTTIVKSIKWCKISGAEILEKRDWAGKYIPIVEVIGKEAFVDGKRITWGLVRPAKDNLRMYNYWASAITEKIGLSPKNPFIGAVGQFETQGGKWDKANKVNYSRLEYDPIDVNGNAVPPPRRSEPAPMEVAMVNMMATIERDVQTSLGIFKAAVGQSESQQSGKAILALQNQSDTGTLHFSDNLARSIRYAGLIIVDLAPKIYDTKRVMRILGEDGESQTALIDPQQSMAKRQVTDGSGNIKNIYNLGVGEYDVSVAVGPSYNTKRLEAAQAFSEMAHGASDPASASVLRYLTVKNSDLTSSDEAVGMLKALLPPQALQADSGQQIPPQAMQKIQMMQQQGQMMQQKLQELDQENQQLKSGAQTNQLKIQSDAQAAQEAHKLKIGMAEAEHQLKLEQANKEAEFNIWKAKLDAATKIEVAEIAAKTTLKQSAINAETDTNLMLSSEIKGEPGQENDIEAMSPLQKLTHLHQQGIDSQNQNMGQLGQILTTIANSMNQMMELQRQTLEVSQRPKSVSIGGVKKDASGRIIGATVNTTIQ